MNCIFCNSPNPKSVEHVIPESLGNDDLALVDEVCSACNAAFSSVENYVLTKTPIAFWRTLLGIRTKKGNLPRVDLSQPGVDKGVWADRHAAHDNGIAFESHNDGSISVDIADDSVLKRIVHGEKSDFRFVFTPKALHLLGRFLAKIGIELLCTSDHYDPRGDRFKDCRKYARHGSQNSLWPLFFFTEGTVSDLDRINLEGDYDLRVDVDCYSYEVKSIGDNILFCLGVGTDRWVMCLSHQYPSPIIRDAFGGKALELIWYSEEQLANKALHRTPSNCAGEL
jgi:hypothetical protein